MFISFSWTTAPFLAGAKTMTRRYWKDSHAKKFKVGTIVDAYDKLPYRGGKKIGTIKITKKPYQQKTRLMLMHDYIREGLLWMHQNNKKIQGKTPDEFFNKWKEKNDTVWVVEFKKI